ncbi:MAG: hypothetical protein VX278_06235, partial [Myxococcota bacterium]|nr:hypothetical protein [Myxococcota bacterium]
MLLNRPSLIFCLFSFWSASAYAQEDGDGWLDDETEEKKAPEDAPTEGVDTAEIYREALSEYKKSLPEEELILWKKYLDDYPNSQFMLQIEKRMDELEGILYNNLDEEARTEEAGKKELDFALPVLLESIDPRKKLRFAFEMGLPNYINLLVDYEHTLSRELSVHGGIRKRYAGWSAEGGAKYALIKSVRTDSLVTALGDVRINTDPFFVALRPQIAGGKSFYFPDDMRLDIMGQIGTEIQT